MSAAVTVVIPVLDDDRVAAAVQSVVASHSGPAALQVIVVDNGSAATFAVALPERLPPGVTVLHESGTGVYRARNRAVEAAEGDVVFFTDADCVVRPGWITAGLDSIAAGADIVQGYSGTVSATRVHRLLQRRYEAPLRRLRAGDATECDTRNLAVHRRVFGELRFEERFRRVGDTDFGLRAEAAGFRVAYQPSMRVDHEHEPDLRLFAAKQACHGWGAQRLMQEIPAIRWHGGHLRTVSRVSRLLARGPGTGLVARLCIRMALLAAGGLEFALPRIPEGMGFWWLTAIDKLAALGGHLDYRPGAPEPSPSRILGRKLARD